MSTAIYVRVSTQEQAERGYSIDEQQDRLKKYCDAMNWKDCAVYVDAGFSGAKTDRPALQKLLKDIHAGRIDKVVVYKLDRLSRSQKDTLYLIEDEFLKNNVDFVSMSENFDTSTPFGRAMIGILSVFAQLEREQIRERMLMGRVARAKQGRFHGATSVPVGYDYQDGQLVVNDYEAIQIKEIFRMYDEGTPTTMIADVMNERGYSHKHGKWTYQTVRNHLQRSVYIGDIHFSGKVYEGLHEPIVDKDTFNRVQKRLETTKNTRYRRQSALLSGLVYCAKCGEKYYKKTNRTVYKGKTTVYHYFSCRNRTDKGGKCDNKIWKLEELEDIVFGEIKKLALDPDAYTVAPADPRPDATRSAIAKIEKQIEKLIELYSVSGISKDVLQGKILELTGEKEKLEASIKEKTEIALPDALKMAEVVDNASPDELRLIITSLIKRIELNGEDITIYWNISDFGS